MSSSKPKVLIDTDAGIDDAVALFMALEAHKRDLIEIVAITTVNGNTTRDNVNVNVFRVLETVNMTQIPVYSGASSCLVENFVFVGPPFHGYDGFRDVLKDEPPRSLSLLQKEHAVCAMIRLIKEYQGELIVAALGPLTNFALVMNIVPDWAAKLKDFYIMGGNIYGYGNVTAAAEFNFAFDPEAAKVVFDRSKITIKLTPWETCCIPFKITMKDRIQLGSTGSPTAKLLNTIENIADCQEEFVNQIMCCDQLCIAWLLDEHAKPFRKEIDTLYQQPLVKKVESMAAVVETTGNHTRGQMVIDRKNLMKWRTNLLCMMDANKDLFLKYLMLAFK